MKGIRCNRLVTSIGELSLGPFPCHLSPGGDVFSRILDQGDSGQRSPVGLIN